MLTFVLVTMETHLLVEIGKMEPFSSRKLSEASQAYNYHNYGCGSSVGKAYWIKVPQKRYIKTDVSLIRGRCKGGRKK